MHWILWGPIAIVLNFVAYYHGKHDLRTLIRPTIQQWPESPEVQVLRTHEPQIFSQNATNITLASVSPYHGLNSSKTFNFTFPIEDDLLVGPDPAAEYDPVDHFLPFLVVILTLFLFGCA